MKKFFLRTSLSKRFRRAPPRGRRLHEDRNLAQMDGASPLDVSPFGGAKACQASAIYGLAPVVTPAKAGVQ